MEQFSHDLTLALEETSRSGTRIGRWGMRRRTRSTGNLPLAPQPTEDSSSSPADVPINAQNVQSIDGKPILLSDSDDRHNLPLSLKTRQKPLIGNFESDSFNENFSPASRPNIRRKRKFKRMAVEYETTPSTPSNVSTPNIFPVGGTVRKRVFKHGQENFKANVIFCGKRKRSHRDRYYDHDKQHSNSVPRQRDMFLPKTSYLEYKSRNRNIKTCERIMPLTKNIVSKIEKISQENKYKLGFEFVPLGNDQRITNVQQTQQVTHIKPEEKSVLRPQQQIEPNQRVPHKSGSFESSFDFHCAIRPDMICKNTEDIDTLDISIGDVNTTGISISSIISGKGGRKSKSLKHREEIMHLQFDDPSFMDCAQNEFSSSSSLSSDSEEIETNESDREGDDELTDWPGNEAMVNFTSKNDFKKAKPKAKPTLPQIKSDDIGQDDDTLMSGEDGSGSLVGTINLSTQSNAQTSLSRYLNSGSCNSFENFTTPHTSPIPSTITTTTNPSITPKPNFNINPVSINKLNQSNTNSNDLAKQKISLPIDIRKTNVSEMSKQIESEMSGETSNHFYSSPNSTCEPREIRAGCRRIRNERPGFSIISSANEELARFLQDGRQSQLKLYGVQDEENLVHFAKLYSLSLEVIDGCTVLTKTSNTTQSVHVEQNRLNKQLLSDSKRRCYGDDEANESGEIIS